MNSLTPRESGLQTSAISCKASFTETACSAISLGSASSSRRSRSFSAESPHRARVPASGWVETRPRASISTTVSGLNP